MTFEESVQAIRNNMREGDARTIATQLNCSKTIVFNALKKPDVKSMTEMEGRAFFSLIDFLADRKKKEEQITKKAITLAQSLTR